MDGFPVAPAAVPHGFAAAQTVQADLREIVCGTDPVDLPPHAVAESAYITGVILQDFQKPGYHDGDDALRAGGLVLLAVEAEAEAGQARRRRFGKLCRPGSKPEQTGGIYGMLWLPTIKRAISRRKSSTTAFTMPTIWKRQSRSGRRRLMRAMPSGGAENDRA